MSPLQQKDRNSALIGTIIFHALLLLAVIFLSLRTPLPLPGEEGVEVNLGYSDDGMGPIQPLTPASTSPPQPSVRESSPEEIVTQDVDEVPMIKEVPKPRERKPEEVKPRTEPQPVQKTEPEQPKVDPRALYPGRQPGQTSGGNQGETGKPGDQGKPTGSPDASGYDGSGGMGDGISFSLEGRKASSLPKPDPRFSETGTVVVSIWVDRSGRVTRAQPGARGTNTTSTTLRRLAEEAAMRARFSAKPDAPEEQRGTITYHFLIRN